MIQVLKKWLSQSEKTKDRQEDGLPSIQHSESKEKITTEEEILDKKEALPRFANRKDLFDQVIQKVAKDYNDVGDQLKTMLEADQMKEGRFLAHTLRGVAGNIGAKKIFEITTCLEDCFALGKKDKAAETIEILSDMMQKLFDHIREITSCEAPPQVSIVPPLVRETTMVELMRILERRRPADCPGVLEMLKTIKIPEGTGLDIDQLINLIERYEFDKAINMLASCTIPSPGSV